jgi:hypothetical protein
VEKALAPLHPELARIVFRQHLPAYRKPVALALRAERREQDEGDENAEPAHCIVSSDKKVQ